MSFFCISRLRSRRLRSPSLSRRQKRRRKVNDISISSSRGHPRVLFRKHALCPGHAQKAAFSRTIPATSATLDVRLSSRHSFAQFPHTSAVQFYRPASSSSPPSPVRPAPSCSPSECYKYHIYRRHRDHFVRCQMAVVRFTSTPVNERDTKRESSTRF